LLQTPVKRGAGISFADVFLNPWQVTTISTNVTLILVKPAGGFNSFAQSDAYCADAFNGRIASILSTQEYNSAIVSVWSQFQSWGCRVWRGDDDTNGPSHNFPGRHRGRVSSSAVPLRRGWQWRGSCRCSSTSTRQTHPGAPEQRQRGRRRQGASSRRQSGSWAWAHVGGGQAVAAAGQQPLPGPLVDLLSQDGWGKPRGPPPTHLSAAQQGAPVEPHSLPSPRHGGVHA
jgi:hypothetical protein